MRIARVEASYLTDIPITPPPLRQCRTSGLDMLVSNAVA